MSTALNNEYLENQVLTAPPHKLHLMLIDGALRFGQRARAALEIDDRAAAEAPLMRTVDIVSEMLIGVRGVDGEVSTRLNSLYAFILGRLAEAKLEADLNKLDEALSLLEYERETWRMAVHGQDAHADQSQPGDNSSRLAGEESRSAPLRIHRPEDDGASSFSLEA